MAMRRLTTSEPEATKQKVRACLGHDGHKCDVAITDTHRKRCPECSKIHTRELWTKHNRKQTTWTHEERADEQAKVEVDVCGRTTRLRDMVRCRSKRRDVTVEACVTGFVDATSVNLKNSACCQCPDGSMLRRRLAAEATR